MVSVARVQQNDSLADLLDFLSRTRVKMLKLLCEKSVVIKNNKFQAV